MLNQFTYISIKNMFTYATPQNSDHPQIIVASCLVLLMQALVVQTSVVFCWFYWPSVMSQCLRLCHNHDNLSNDHNQTSTAMMLCLMMRDVLIPYLFTSQEIIS